MTKRKTRSRFLGYDWIEMETPAPIQKISKQFFKLAQTAVKAGILYENWEKAARVAYLEAVNAPAKRARR